MTVRQVTRWMGFFAISALFLTVGCQTIPHSAEPDKRKPDPEALYQHVLEVNAEGFAYDLTKDKDELMTDAERLRNYLQATIFEGIQTSGTKKILVFVHGGLNAQNQGRGHFKTDYRHILEAGYYPVFVVWPSGWVNTYVEHLTSVRQGLKADTDAERVFSWGTLPFVLLGDLGRSLMRLPLVIANNTRSDLETVNAIRKVENRAAVGNYWSMQTWAHVAIGDDYTLPSDWCWRAVSYWSTIPVKYISASFIDGFGKGAWDNMLRRTQLVYPARYGTRTATNLVEQIIRPSLLPGEQALQQTGPKSKRQRARARRSAAGGLPMFIEELYQLQLDDPSLEITLVGHSMGTIILNRVVRDAALEVANLVYMGAACSVDDFSRSVLPYMNDHTNTQFYNLSLHPVAEAGEWQESLADLPPRGSLLVWIDNFLSNPVTEQERTLGRWRNLFRSDVAGMPIVSQFYVNGSNLTNRLHFEAFSVGYGDSNQLRVANYQWNGQPIAKNRTNRVDNPLVHGEFSEMPYWKPEFWWNTNIAQVRVSSTTNGHE